MMKKMFVMLLAIGVVAAFAIPLIAVANDDDQFDGAVFGGNGQGQDNDDQGDDNDQGKDKDKPKPPVPPVVVLDYSDLANALTEAWYALYYDGLGYEKYTADSGLDLYYAVFCGQVVYNMQADEDNIGPWYDHPYFDNFPGTLKDGQTKVDQDMIDFYAKAIRDAIANLVLKVVVGADLYGDLSIVESANNTWTITFTVTEIFNDGTSKSVEYSFDTAKNSKGEVVLNGVYKVVFDIAGNGTNIKAFYFVLI